MAIFTALSPVGKMNHRESPREGLVCDRVDKFVCCEKRGWLAPPINANINFIELWEEIKATVVVGLDDEWKPSKKSDQNHRVEPSQIDLQSPVMEFSENVSPGRCQEVP